MYKGRLSYYSAAVLGLVGVFFLGALSLSFYGINNASGDFLKESFTYASFYIPLYIFTAAILAFRKRFRSKSVILLTSTILPFLTLVLFLKVFLEIDSSPPVLFVVDVMGRKEGSFLLFLLFLVESLLIYIFSMKISISNSADLEENIKEADNLSREVTGSSDEDEAVYSTPAILRTGVLSDRLEAENSTKLPGNPFTGSSVDLPELHPLNNLKSIPSVYSESEKDFSIDYGGGNQEENPEELEELEEIEEYETNDEVDPEDEVFSEVGEGHLINTDDSSNNSLDSEIIEKKAVKTKKKFTYANYSVPTKNILNDYADGHYWVIDDQTRLAAGVLKETLEEFKIKAEVTGIQKGPVITMFEILPAPGVKLSKIANLADNIAMRLAASRVRIVAPIPGKHAVGIEIPNKERAIVSFKEMLNDDKFQDPKNEIPVAIGKDITGNTQIIDLVKTPHLLIAGATGSGKSVCVNALICSILYKRTPDQVRLILIDPKIVELKLYNDIPHLLTPVITEPKRAFQALQYCIYIMEQRYVLLDSMGVRDIRSYNKKIIRNRIATKKLPYIVVVVDEFADLIATSGKELESILARLAAMARAVGIHLVLATQRPSIDVITGLIKANIPSRIAFMVSNKIDSRIILDTAGADKLLGQGDMLFSSAWDPSLTRIQGAFLSDSEVEGVTEYIKTLGEPDYIDDEIFYDDEGEDTTDTGSYNTNDPLMDKAVEIVVAAGKASASYLQRRLQIGYNRAARIVEEMEARGIVGPPNGSKPREILHVP
ncbi:MAG: DNA translocase FtsK, partial [Spirochaetales bacterium]|nr:DNA translocase FtsK [Spirochaetales bacterium]